MADFTEREVLTGPGVSSRGSAGSRAIAVFLHASGVGTSARGACGNAQVRAMPNSVMHGLGRRTR